MSTHIHIDRQAELAAFEELLAGSCAENILLIQALPGRGKTWLVMEYQKLARQRGTPCAVVDLRVTGPRVSDVMATLGEEWGWEHFEGFRASVASAGRAAHQVDLRGILQIGRPQIQVVLAAESEHERRERLRWLTDALMADVRSWLSGSRPRAVLIVDTYNPKGVPDTVGPELQEWLEGVLLPHARRTPGLVMVIAGQQVPAASAAWESCCRRLELGPLNNPDDWMEFVHRLGARVSREIVAAYCHTCQGEPLTIATHLSMLRTFGGGT